MIKLISAIFTAGVVVGIAVVVRQRHIAGKTEHEAETIDHSNNDGNNDSNNDGATEPEEPVTVPAERA